MRRAGVKVGEVCHLRADRGDHRDLLLLLIENAAEGTLVGYLDTSAEIYWADLTLVEFVSVSGIQVEDSAAVTYAVSHSTAVLALTWDQAAAALALSDPIRAAIEAGQ